MGADVTTSLFVTHGASLLAVRTSGTGVSFMLLEKRVLKVLHNRGAYFESIGNNIRGNNYCRGVCIVQVVK